MLSKPWYCGRSTWDLDICQGQGPQRTICQTIPLSLSRIPPRGKGCECHRRYEERNTLRLAIKAECRRRAMARIPTTGRAGRCFSGPGTNIAGHPPALPVRTQLCHCRPSLLHEVTCAELRERDDRWPMASDARPFATCTDTRGVCREFEVQAWPPRQPRSLPFLPCTRGPSPSLYSASLAKRRRGGREISLSVQTPRLRTTPLGSSQGVSSGPFRSGGRSEGRGPGSLGDTFPIRCAPRPVYEWQDGERRTARWHMARSQWICRREPHQPHFLGLLQTC